MTQPRTALVTGANRGLGRATAELLHAMGLRTVVAARDPGEAAALAAELGRPAAWTGLDTTDADSVGAARDRIGPVDILVNNAGVLLDAGNNPLTAPMDSALRTLEVNVLGTWRLSQAFVPAMMERGWGRVVMVSSGTGTFSHGLFTGAPAYSLSKTALNGLTTLLAAHTKGTGVLVNAVNPGPVRTRMMPRAERTPREAAEDIAGAATLPDDGPSGVLFKCGRISGW
ncbi:SDR family NAD(P)-dependent oxidoreductase [Streptomyces sp. NPDC001262]|uniref:SDR family NAD(P)-dependent oxidoreductase n=1 Tax=Streptomyces TaxID=1883 RepID=UPI0036B75D56